VVEATGPVNLAVDGAGGDFCGGVVDYVMGIAWARSIWRGVIRRGGLRARGVNYLYYSGIA